MEKMYGDIANVNWKSISDYDLSRHPLFNSLKSQNIHNDIAMFAQHTDHWNALHQGRLTTSSLAACLGFYEPQCADKLGVPKSLRSHHRIVSAWEQLRKRPISRSELLNSYIEDCNKVGSSNIIWAPSSSGGFPFDYNPSNCAAIDNNYNNALDVRLAWGTCQESTAILAVINYLYMSGVNARVSESGICPLEHLVCNPHSELYATLASWLSEGLLPLIGASPDGIIRYEDGRVEVLEVKCVSPYQETSGIKATHRFKWCEKSISAESVGDSGVAVWHIPQLQLEMLCAGANCQSALITVLYVNGAQMFRVNRNDAYILSMMTLVREFYTQFIKSVPSNKMKPPPINYNYPINSKLYQQFILQTIEIAKSAILVTNLSNEQIQRNETNCNSFL